MSHGCLEPYRRSTAIGDVKSIVEKQNMSLVLFVRKVFRHISLGWSPRSIPRLESSINMDVGREQHHLDYTASTQHEKPYVYLWQPSKAISTTSSKLQQTWVPTSGIHFATDSRARCNSDRSLTSLRPCQILPACDDCDVVVRECFSSSSTTQLNECTVAPLQALDRVSRQPIAGKESAFYSVKGKTREDLSPEDVRYPPDRPNRVAPNTTQLEPRRIQFREITSCPREQDIPDPSIRQPVWPPLERPTFATQTTTVPLAHNKGNYFTSPMKTKVDSLEACPCQNTRVGVDECFRGMLERQHVLCGSDCYLLGDLEAVLALKYCLDIELTLSEFRRAIQSQGERAQVAVLSHVLEALDIEQHTTKDYDPQFSNVNRLKGNLHRTKIDAHGASLSGCLSQEHNHGAVKCDSAGFFGDHSVKSLQNRTSLLRPVFGTAIRNDQVQYEKSQTISKSDNSQHLPMKCKTLGYTLDKTRVLSTDASPEYWSYKMYANEQGQRPKCSVFTNKDLAEEMARLFLEEIVVGFDMEWEIAKRRGRKVSLVQLASQDRIALFHLAKFEGFDTMDDLLPPSLKQVLEDPGIVKTGVHIKADSTVLSSSTKVRMQSIFELSHLYNLLEGPYEGTDDIKQYSKKAVALATQVQKHLQMPIKKDSVRISNWNATLTEEQKDYAACDAYASLQLYYVMEQKRLLIKPYPPPPPSLVQ